MSTLGVSTHSHRLDEPAQTPWLATRYRLPAGLALAMLGALLLPLNLLVTQRFHHDEALYATWALQIASGENPLLSHVPIDKPPLFLYTVAGALKLLGHTETAARLPSLLATVVNVGLSFWLGRKLYGNKVGLLAAWLVALSPFTILFAPTAFTDPMLVAMVLAGGLAAAYHQTVWSGIFLGLAVATKQQGLFFVPLAVMLLGLGVESRGVGVLNALGKFLVGLALTLLPVFLWDAARNPPAGFWQLSFINYGGLNTSIDIFGERLSAFVELLNYATASRLLNIVFIVGLPLLLAYGIIKQQAHPQTSRQLDPYLFDLTLAAFILIFLLAHTLISFQVWDRYLLGLIPLLALLMARILLLPWSLLKQHWLSNQPALLPAASFSYTLLLIVLLVLTLARPVQDAANARYPLGSHSYAFSGINQIVAFLQGTAYADTTLYHRWLGTHWRFYLWGYPYDLQYWPSPEALAARARPGHLIAFPAWHSDTAAQLALAQAGLDLQEVARAHTPAGNPSIVLHKIVEKGVGSEE